MAGAHPMSVDVGLAPVPGRTWNAGSVVLFGGHAAAPKPAPKPMNEAGRVP